MRSAIIIVVSCIFCVSVNAWVSLIQHDPRFNHLGYCYSESSKLSMKRGEERRLGNQCAMALCREDRDISVTGCGSVAIEPPCRVVDGDLSKPYPDCCYEIECPEGYPKKNLA